MKITALKRMLEIETGHFDELAEKKVRIDTRLDASANEIERLKTEIAANSITEARKPSFSYLEIE